MGSSLGDLPAFEDDDLVTISNRAEPVRHDDTVQPRKAMRSTIKRSLSVSSALVASSSTRIVGSLVSARGDLEALPLTPAEVATALGQLSVEPPPAAPAVGRGSRSPRKRDSARSREP